MKQLTSTNQDFWRDLKALLAFETAQNPEVDATVAAICAKVAREGDAALLTYTRQFDGLVADTMADVTLVSDDLEAAFLGLPAAQKEALEVAAQRIERYHQHQKQTSWQFRDETGTLLGQKITPLDRVGIYVPGGKAAYPSSVLMNAIPARVAGVSDVVMVVPTPKGERNPLVLAAAYVAGVSCVYTVGGAQAVAALAYGTETIPQVDKITGPGNAYVAAAKRRVFGVVGIDMVAGPSEILVIADGSAPAKWLTMDLFSQAEHDEIAQAILICPHQDYLQEVQNAMEALLSTMPRRDIIEASLQNRGAMIAVRDLEEACEIANFIAPEHLELVVENPSLYVDKLRHAGAIFMGPYTSESLGDYCAGPNHVLPTSRTARFASALGVYDFQKRTSLIEVSAEGAALLGRTAATLAKGEGLVAHEMAARFRFE